MAHTAGAGRNLAVRRVGPNGSPQGEAPPRRYGLDFNDSADGAPAGAGCRRGCAFGDRQRGPATRLAWRAPARLCFSADSGLAQTPDFWSLRCPEPDGLCSPPNPLDPCEPQKPMSSQFVFRVSPRGVGGSNGNRRERTGPGRRQVLVGINRTSPGQ